MNRVMVAILIAICVNVQAHIEDDDYEDDLELGSGYAKSDDPGVKIESTTLGASTTSQAESKNLVTFHDHKMQVSFIYRDKQVSFNRNETVSPYNVIASDNKNPDIKNFLALPPVHYHDNWKFDIEFFQDTIKITDQNGGLFRRLESDKFVFTDINNTLPRITNVTLIDDGFTYPGFKPELIKFDDDNIYIDIMGIKCNFNNPKTDRYNPHNEYNGHGSECPEFDEEWRKKNSENIYYITNKQKEYIKEMSEHRVPEIIAFKWFWYSSSISEIMEKKGIRFWEFRSVRKYQQCNFPEGIGWNIYCHNENSPTGYNNMIKVKVTFE